MHEETGIIIAWYPSVYHKSGHAAFMSFSLTALHTGFAFVRPFARARKEFLPNSYANVADLRSQSEAPWPKLSPVGAIGEAEEVGETTNANGSEQCAD